ncbi:hypothetical protein WMF11_46885 [Sorangium sp. So ce295]|uniref:RCC1 domain-containing protein n=1 Tax=Sorangium sp. So ce295 TaxID=3133295 RepID=UPI003F5FD2C8
MHRLRLPMTALGFLTIATLALCTGCSPSERNFASAGGGQGGGAGHGSAGGEGGASGQGSGGGQGGAGGQGVACTSPKGCPAGENAEPTCDDGVCGLACDAGFLDCDAAAPGCEASARDPQHCGACGRRCAMECVDGAEGAFCNDPVEISAGFAHTCVLRGDGSVWCWGRNTFGEAGAPVDEPTLPWPTRVSLPGKAIHVAAGGGFSRTDNITPGHSCAVMEDTTVVCWGNGRRGQIGNGSYLDSAGPTRVASLINVVQISLGAAHSCAVKTGDELYCWGSDEEGQIGNGAAEQSGYATPLLVRSDIRQVAAGQDHTCAIKASDGGVLCWGRNFDGQLGNGGQTSSPSPVNVLAPLAAGVDEVAAGDRHTCARKGAEVYCFGNDYNGAVGANRSGPVPEPTLVAVPRATRIDVGRERSGAVSGDARALKMWGVAFLGNGDEGLSTQPVDVPINGVAQLAGGYQHTCALKTTGEILCWGENAEGQLGVGQGVGTQPSPVAVKFEP